MNKRAAGVMFIFLATIFICTKFISTAIYASSEAAWNAGIFKDQLKEIGNTLDILSILSLIVGIIYLYFAERNKG